MRDRSAAFRSQQHQYRIEARAGRLEAVDFFNVLTGPQLLEKTETLLPEHRERQYPPTVTLSMFLEAGAGGRPLVPEGRQCLDCSASGGRAESCERAHWRIQHGGARQRLPVEMVSALTHEVGGLLCAQAQRGWRWRGRTVKLSDGTGISMQDTEENQASYPQPSSQAEGVGFPLMRLTGVICLSTGAVLDVAMGPHAGKGNSELGLFRQLERVFCAGDVMLADALYCNYFLITRLQALGVDVLFEQHGSRMSDFRRGEPLGARDHIVRWEKPKTRPQWMHRKEYAAFPSELTVREIRVDGRVLVTTLLDHRKVSKGELSRLYEQRWNVELDFRNIKTTLGVEVLSCKTPQMIEKELWVYLLAYNLIRLLMVQAALHAGVHPRQLSFKHTVQIWTAWVAQGLAGSLSAHNDTLFRTIAQLKVGNRPDRVEPRARKRRPKSYQ